jgi:hypothetical protein
MERYTPPAIRFERHQGIHAMKKNVTFLAPALLAAVLLGTAPCHARGGMHWETLHVYNTEPTEIFTHLGLTHSTRYGHTLGQKHIPDPTFPPGLTDVVPYNPGHTLLVRGTTVGLAAFRVRVVAADVPDTRWQLLVMLRRKDGKDAVLAQQTKEVRLGAPTMITFDSPGQMPEYEITVKTNSDGSLAVTRRTSLTLQPAPAAAATSVFVPAQVWTVPITQNVSPGAILTFNDLASDRSAARQALEQPGTDPNGDYSVQIQVTNAAPSPAPTPTPTPVSTPVPTTPTPGVQP